MASIITGSDCTLTIDDVDYSCTINSYTCHLTPALRVPTLCGP